MLNYDFLNEIEQENERIIFLGHSTFHRNSDSGHEERHIIKTFGDNLFDLIHNSQ